MAGLRPGVREVDMDERRPAAVADAPLEPALAVDAGVGVEDRAQGLADLVAGAYGVSFLVGRRRIASSAAATGAT